MIEARGCKLLFSAACSPKYDPIEEAFSKIKALLRKVKARTREAPIEVLGEAISAVTSQDVRGFLEHRGYQPSESAAMTDAVNSILFRLVNDVWTSPAMDPCMIFLEYINDLGGLVGLAGSASSARWQNRPLGSAGRVGHPVGGISLLGGVKEYRDAA